MDDQVLEVYHARFQLYITCKPDSGSPEKNAEVLG